MTRTDIDRLAALCDKARKELYPELSRDGLLTSPRSASRACDRVREHLNRTARAGCTDELILRAWLNAAKRSKGVGLLPRRKGGRS